MRPLAVHCARAVDVWPTGVWPTGVGGGRVDACRYKKSSKGGPKIPTGTSSWKRLWFVLGGGVLTYQKKGKGANDDGVRRINLLICTINLHDRETGAPAERECPTNATTNDSPAQSAPPTRAPRPSTAERRSWVAVTRGGALLPAARRQALLLRPRVAVSVVHAPGRERQRALLLGGRVARIHRGQLLRSRPGDRPRGASAHDKSARTATTSLPRAHDASDRGTARNARACACVALPTCADGVCGWQGSDASDGDGDGAEAVGHAGGALLSSIMTADGNQVCADCGESSSAPDWVAMPYGCVVCIECSGIHRSLGVHISKVRPHSRREARACTLWEAGFDWPHAPPGRTRPHAAGQRPPCATASRAPSAGRHQLGAISWAPSAGRHQLGTMRSPIAMRPPVALVSPSQACHPPRRRRVVTGALSLAGHVVTGHGPRGGGPRQLRGQRRPAR